MRSGEALQAFEVRSRPDLDSLPQRQLETMAEAGREIVEIYRILAKTGDNIVGEVLRDHGTFYEWDHFPPGDVYDHETHGQYYYHAHPSEQRFADEHGHFHTFLRPKGMPPGVAPASLPGWTPPEDPDDALSHLVGIAMDRPGFPFRLFTVNRWVTGETWYEAADVIAMLDAFEIDHARPSWPANRWIGAMVRLFRPQIEDLLRARDRVIAERCRERAAQEVLEDRALEITSYTDISVEEQVRAVAASLLARF